MTTMKTGRLRLRSAVLVVAAATMMAACSGDGESPLSSVQPPAEEPAPEEPAPEPTDAPAPEPTDAPAPEPTDAPAPEPTDAPEEPAPQEPPADEGEPLTSEEWAFLILIGLLVLAVLAGLIAFLRRSPGQPDNRVADQVAAQRQLDDITQNCRSIHDSTVVGILQVSDPATLQSTWGATRPQLVSLEGRISYLIPSLVDPGAQRTVSELGTAVGAVRGALDSNVALRLDTETPGQPDLVEASNRTVLGRSQQLELAIQQALYIRL